MIRNPILPGFYLQEGLASAGESITMEFAVPFEKLGYYDQKMDYTLEAGEFAFFVGGNSRDTLSETIHLSFI